MDLLILEPKMQLTQIISNCYSECLNYHSFIDLETCEVSRKYGILFEIPIHNVPPDVEIVHAKLRLILMYKKLKYTNVFSSCDLKENWILDRVTCDNQPSCNIEIYGEKVKGEETIQYIFDITSQVQRGYINGIENKSMILRSPEIYSSNLKRTLADLQRLCESKVEITYRLKGSCGEPLTLFINKSEEMNVEEGYSFSKMINTSLMQTGIFFIKNLDGHEIEAHLQVSPDGINFIDEPTTVSVKMNEIKFIVACIFAKFTRVVVRNVHCCEVSRVKIWYQAQAQA